MPKIPPKISHLLFSTLLFSLFSLSLSKLCNPNDESILLKLKQQLGNSSYLATYWNASTDCCKNWGDTACDDQGHVTYLYIGVVDDISGVIPPIIGDLTSLQRLEFWNRNLTGPIPRSICKLSNLQYLSIRSTHMSGSIPKCINRLKNLTQIDISFNTEITGSIPKELGELPLLNFLQMPANSLTGSIPDELGQLPSLQWINFEWNQLTGSIPASLGLIPKLTVIVLDNNQLTGSIPETFGSFQNPITLQLNGNRLSGPIPRSMGQVNAYLMDFSSNQLTGDASFLFGRKKNFTQSILLGNNQFEFDFSYVDLPIGLQNLNISHNKIYGSLPKLLGQLPLRSIDVSYNQLCGPIPTGRRLKRFNPVYFGHNKCLCGLPLPPCMHM